jgi:hypothetical protein
MFARLRWLDASPLLSFGVGWIFARKMPAGTPALRLHHYCQRVACIDRLPFRY